MNLIMCNRKLHSCWFTSALVFILVINLSFSLPLPQTLYSSFVADLKANHCTLPSNILFLNSPNVTAESSLQICNSSAYLKYNKEVEFLCNETFNLLKNISCPPFNIGLDKVKFTLSENVCDDFADYKDLVMPKGLLKHLTDNFTCNMLCPDDVKPSCQVLLWSFLVQSHIKSSKPPEPLPDKIFVDVNPDQEKDALQNDPKLLKTQNQVSDPKNFPAIQTDQSINKSIELTSKPENNLETNNKKDKELKPPIKIPDSVIPTIEKYTAEKAIAETQLLVNSSSTIGKATLPSSVNLNGKDAVVADALKPKITDQQSSDNSISASIQTKPTESVNIVPVQNTNQANQKEVKVEEATKQNESKQKIKSPVGQVDGNDTKPPTNSETLEEKANPQEVVDVPKEEPSNPKSDKPSKVSDTISSSEPSVVSVQVSEISTNSPLSPTPSLEKMEDEIPLPNEKEPDQYTDLENGDNELDGEYPKQDYGDNGMYEALKTKGPISEAPKKVDVPKESVVSQREDLLDFNRIPSRDSFGRGSEEIQVLTTFPNQEDGHFFFYLLTIVLIFMAGYLIFHNKQKIIALIVEGRHERRRRSHGLGYRKLETK